MRPLLRRFGRLANAIVEVEWDGVIYGGPSISVDRRVSEHDLRAGSGVRGRSVGGAEGGQVGARKNTSDLSSMVSHTRGGVVCPDRNGYSYPCCLDKGSSS